MNEGLNTETLTEELATWSSLFDEAQTAAEAEAQAAAPVYVQASRPEEVVPDYLALEQDLEGIEWVEAAALREDGYLREDFASEASVEFVSSAAYPSLDRSPAKNWVDQVGGLPKYIERIAKHLVYESGRTVGVAIAIAVNAVKRMCATGDTNLPGMQSVNSGSRAEACKATAEWERKKAQSKMQSAAKGASKKKD